MSELEEFLSSQKDKIEKLLNGWYTPNDPQRVTKELEIRKWLSNPEFNTHNDGICVYEDAFFLLSKIEYVQDSAIDDHIKFVMRALKGHLKDLGIEKKDIIFRSLSDSIPNGVSSYLKRFSEIMHLDERQIPQSGLGDVVNKRPKAIVFVDDLVGSSANIQKFAAAHDRELRSCEKKKIKLFHLSFFCFNDNISLLKNIFHKVETSRVLTKANKAFEEENPIFRKDKAARLRIKKWCRALGEDLYSKGPLGYDDSQLLIVFRTNTPNNTLPIFWAGIASESEDQAAKRWSPVFPRDTSAYTNKEEIPIEGNKHIFTTSGEPVEEGKVKVFLNHGHYISAINVILNGRQFEGIHLEDKLQIIEIEQKAGLLESARNHIDLMLDHPDLHKIDATYLAEIHLLDLKISCQENRFEDVIEKHHSVISLIDDNLKAKRKCSVYHRTGVSYAIDRDVQNTQECLKNSLKISKEQNLTHSNITCRMYSSLIKGFVGIETDIPDPIEEVIKCGEEYFNNEENKDLWKYNILKSSLQCLFAEACLLLYQGQEEAGFLRLTAANLFAYYIKSDPKSEGYAELLALLPDNENVDKELITLAMHSDINSHNEFQKNAKRVVSNLLSLRPLLDKIGTNTTYEDWRKLREFFDDPSLYSIQYFRRH